MTEDQKQSYRRLIFKAWLLANGGARKSCMKKGLGKSVESHISQVLRGYSFGARAARKFEDTLGMPHGMLDGEPQHETAISTNYGCISLAAAEIFANKILNTIAAERSASLTLIENS